jgi:hypothetical protein
MHKTLSPLEYKIQLLTQEDVYEEVIYRTQIAAAACGCIRLSAR